VTGEMARRLNTQELGISKSPVTALQLAGLLGRIADGTISNNAAKQVFDELWSNPAGRHFLLSEDEQAYRPDFQPIDAIIEAKGLKQMSDTGELEAIIDTVLASNAKSVEEYKAGNAKAFNALVGQAMKATKGKGNPAQVNELLKKKLG
jgi:aspartyl-tRNA(Asn)/glutamyl-tRNA(Gln) amidotransferase subunit B